MRIVRAVADEPIGLIGLVVAIFAVIPSYWSLFSSSNYTYDFTCSEIGLDAPAFLVEGGVHKDFVAVRSKCDFSNLDDQTITIKAVAPTASFESASDFAVDLTLINSNSLGNETFSTLDRSMAHPVLAGETLLFDGVYMIPVATNWQLQQDNCAELAASSVVSFGQVANCIPDLRRECLMPYLEGMNFWSGAGSTTPYRALAIRLKLTDGSYARAPIDFAWYFKLGPSDILSDHECPNPDKT